MEMEIIVSAILLSLGIAGLVTLHACIVSRALRNEYDNNEIYGIGGKPNMSQDEIKKLPSFGYKVEERGKSRGECAVCLESFVDGDPCRLLPNCKHSFHVQCIDLWLMKMAICPICRDDVNSTKEVEPGKSSTELGAELV